MNTSEGIKTRDEMVIALLRVLYPDKVQQAQSIADMFRDYERARPAPSEPIPDAEAHPDHYYTSTACIHGVHNRCRWQCEFCSVKCGCICHAMQQLEMNQERLEHRDKSDKEPK